MARSLGLLALLIALCALPARAHLTPNSAIELAVGNGAIAVTITVPESEWAYAYGRRTVAPYDVGWLLEVTAPDDRKWQIGEMQAARVVHEGVPDLIITAVATPPPGAPLRRFALSWNGVIERVASHAALVSSKSDFAGGTLAEHPRLLGSLQGETRTLAIDLGEASAWNGIAATFGLGVSHILEGYDHLLFLLALLLPAPLVAAGGRWAAPDTPRAAIRRLILIVTAFTIGHSLTLIAGALFNWTLPVQPVEIAIALSVLVSAIHAARPIFPGREAFVAAGFGLIHGMAFATIVASFELPPGDRALAILGFNVGIEAVQLAIATLVLPILIFAARSKAYAPFRLTAAALTGAAALWWLWERV